MPVNVTIQFGHFLGQKTFENVTTSSTTIGDIAFFTVTKSDGSTCRFIASNILSICEDPVIEEARIFTDEFNEKFQ